MTTDQEMAAIGRLVNDLRNSKRRLVALESEFDRAGENLTQLGSSFRLALRSPADDALADPSLDSGIERLASQQTLTDLLADLRAERQKFKDLSKRVAELGISL